MRTLSSSCSNICRHLSIRRSDSVHITENSHGGKDGDTRVISNREQIDALYRVVLSQSGVWRRPTFDAPFLRWMVEFIRDGRILGSYGVGANFLEVNGYLHHLQPRSCDQCVVACWNQLGNCLGTRHLRPKHGRWNSLAAWLYGDNDGKSIGF